MSHAHSPDCEHADVGSLCDCDCAGSRHAVKRTKGAVAAAGAVSKRAQAVAHRAGRAPVVNNKAEPNGIGRNGKLLPGKTPDTTPDVTPPPAKKVVPPVKKLPPPPPPTPPLPPVKPPPVVKPPRAKKAAATITASKPSLVSPGTAAKLKAARASLPTGTGWQDAAKEKADAKALAAHTATVRRAQAALDRVEAKRQAIMDGHVEQVIAETPKHYGTPEFIREQAVAIAPHRAWNNPAYNALETPRYNAQRKLRDATAALEAAQSTASYPIDAKSKLRMPTKALDAHLDTVVEAGRAVLADAKAAWSRNPPPEVAVALGRQAFYKRVLDEYNDLQNNVFNEVFKGNTPVFRGRTVHNMREFDALVAKYKIEIATANLGIAADRRIVARHQQNVLMDVLASARPFGGPGHVNATAKRDPLGAYGATDARTDWRERLTAAEQFFPADWLNRSAADPLAVGTSDRAYYNTATQLLSMSVPQRDKDYYDGGFADDTAEVNVHEMGHRMETKIDGLTELEFAMQRRHARLPDGSVEPIKTMPGYVSTEVAQADDWTRAYAGKTYEKSTTLTAAEPGGSAWEVFQVGLQDTFGRGSKVYGRRGDPEELQAFVIGALLTL